MTDNEILMQLLNEVRDLKTGQTRMETRMDSLETGQATLAAKVEATQAYIETEVVTQIKLVAEQHGSLTAKLDALADYPQTKDRVAVLEQVSREHSDDIKHLQAKAV